MNLTVTASDIAWRLILTIIAGGVIGLNRGEHGRPAGLRTVLLVTLAAALSMILGNLLLSTTGKDASSFVNIDVMRLPLGILTGVGFIGAGAILHRDNLVVGVTTAATLWFVTVMGLCFGSGHLGLGTVAFVLGMGSLWALEYAELQLPQDHRGTLFLVVARDAISEEELRQIFTLSGCRVLTFSTVLDNSASRHEFACEITWRAKRIDSRAPKFVNELASRDGIVKLGWNPVGNQSF
jgi:putative Mg2+ transporter-C (MgtC) family protein